MTKKVIVVFLVVLAIGTLVGSACLYSEKNTDTEINMAEFVRSSFKRFNPSDMFVKPIGRTHYSDKKRYISMSGSGIEFLCKGSYAYITVIGDEAEKQRKNCNARFAIYKNDELIYDDTVNFKKKKYHIDINDFENGAVIKLVKLSEAKNSGFYIGTIGAFSSGDIEPTDDKELKIEFFGDSMTCGYGIDAGAVGAFSTETENFTKTYAYITSQNLKADYSAVCFSGYGLLSGYTANGVINREGTVGQYFDKSALYSDGGKALWNFADFQPNFVVINLGANDSTYCSTTQRRLAFSVKYTDFLKQLRVVYPDAHIICALGDMNQTLLPAVEKAVEDFKLSSGDESVSVFVIPFKMGEYEIVIDGHPGAQSNEYAAEALSAEIMRIIKSKEE